MQLYIKFIVILLFLGGNLFGQTKIGSIETSNGKEIDIYPRSVATDNKRALTKTCDCMIEDYTNLVYVNGTGEVIVVNLSKINLIRLDVGAKYCSTFNGDLYSKNKISDKSVFNSRHWGDGDEFYQLYTTIFENESYAISVEQNFVEYGQIVIHDKSSRKVVFDNECYIFKVGIGNKGEKALEKIQEYFADCTNLMASIEKKNNYNKTVSKLKRKFLLADLPDSCD